MEYCEEWVLWYIIAQSEDMNQSEDVNKSGDVNKLELIDALQWECSNVFF